MSRYKDSADRILNHFAVSAEASPIYKIHEFDQGDNPLTAGETSEYKEQLIDAVFLSKLQHTEAKRTDIKFDKVMISRGNQSIEVNTKIESCGERFVVVDVDPIAPSDGEELAYRSFLSKT